MTDSANPVQETPAQRPETPEERAARWQAIERRYAEADARAAGLCREIFQPLLGEFRQVLESDGVLVHGVPQQGRDINGPHWACYTAADAATRKQLYLVRLAALAYRDGPLVLSCECRHDPRRACRTRPPKTPLVESASFTKTLDDCRIDDDDARRWVEEILKRSTEALMDAIYKKEAPPAPVCAPLAAAPVFGEAMTFEL